MQLMKVPIGQAPKLHCTGLRPDPAICHGEVVKGPRICLGADCIISSINVTVLDDGVVGRLNIYGIGVWGVEVTVN